jgi:predicted molibdopterin-dependent oxidoreductase YjgC
VAFRLGIEKLDFPPRDQKYPKDTSNKMIERDPGKCILCGRCVRACNEVQVNEAIDFGYRGVDTKITTEWDLPYKESNCVFCGACLSVCPTGAIIGKRSKFQSRPWNLKKVRTTCVYCGTGCQLDLNVAGNRVISVSPDFLHGPPNYGFLCVKGMFGNDFIHHEDRLTKPLVKRNGSFVETSWDEALDTISDRFIHIKETHGPNALAALSSARCTNEENYLLQKLFRAGIGTNNIDHCARL